MKHEWKLFMSQNWRGAKSEKKREFYKVMHVDIPPAK